MDGQLGFTPRSDLVFVTLTEDHLVYKGLIQVADPEGHDQARRGLVHYVGPKVKDVKPGDKVVFGKWFGEPVKWDGKRLLCMHESDVLGVEE